MFSTQISSQVAQSVVLGYLADYFGIEDPTDEDTRNAYLYALGNLLFWKQWEMGGCMFVFLHCS